MVIGFGERDSGFGSIGNSGGASVKMAPMKLAEFRYGREEMLALFDEVRHEEKDPPDEYDFLKQMTLWLAKPQTPLNKQVGLIEQQYLYRVTKVHGDTYYVDIKMRVASSI